MRYNPPPNWPAPPPGWTPQPGWEPNPAWGPEPPGWPLWVDEAPRVDETPAYSPEPPPAYANPNPGHPHVSYTPPYQPPYGPMQYGPIPYGPIPPRRRTGALWFAGIAVVAVIGVVVAVLLMATSGHLGGSDEDQVRETVSAMEAAYNEADPVSFRDLICDAKRSDFSEDAEDMRQTLEFGGEITLNVDRVYISGDGATAEVNGEIFAEPFEETWRFIREDNHWRWCGD